MTKIPIATKRTIGIQSNAAAYGPSQINCTLNANVYSNIQKQNE